MKILFFIHSLVIGGAEKILLELAESWSHLHSVSILTLTGPEKDFYPVPAGVNRFSLEKKTKHWYNFFGIVLLLGRIRKKTVEVNPDYIISFMAKSNIFCLMAGLGLNKKIIICERNIIKNPDMERRQYILRKWLYPGAYKITVQHNYIFKELLDVYPNIKPEKVYITPNPVKNIPTDAVEQLDLSAYFTGIGKDDKLLMGIGRFTPVKAFKDLILMFSIIKKTRKDVRLVLLGDGHEYEECSELVKQLALEQYVSLPGSINNMVPWYCTAHIFVTTTHYEGFPNALAESLAAGIPSVAFDIPSVAFLLKNEINGYLIKDRNRESMAEKICFLIDNPDVYSRMSNEAKKITVDYSIENINKIWFNEILI